MQTRDDGDERDSQCVDAACQCVVVVAGELFRRGGRRAGVEHRDIARNAGIEAGGTGCNVHEDERP